MNPTDPTNLIKALSAHPCTPHSRPLRVCTRGEKAYRWAWMAGGVGVPVGLETGEEVERLMAERKAVEV